MNLGLEPWFEPSILEDRGEIRVIRDRFVRLTPFVNGTLPGSP